MEPGDTRDTPGSATLEYCVRLADCVVYFNKLCLGYVGGHTAISQGHVHVGLAVAEFCVRHCVNPFGIRRLTFLSTLADVSSIVQSW